MSLLFTNNFIVAIYLAVFLFLSAGVYRHSGFAHFDKLGIYLFSFLFFSFAAKKLSKKISLKNYATALNERMKFSSRLSLVFLVLILAAIAIHFLQLKTLPLIAAWNCKTIVETAKVRQDITQNASAFINYLSSFTVKAFIPFFLLYFYAMEKKKIFFFLLLVSLFYVLNLLQKNYLLFIFMPLLMWLLTAKKFLRFALFSAIPVFLIFFQVYVSNPELRSEGEKPKTKKALVITSKSAESLGTRIFFLPGKIVSEWFNHIPAELPFLNGCGYRFAAKFIGCEYRDYSAMLYEKIYPRYAGTGLQGTVNTASFVYDYSNFGKMGLLFSSALMAVFFLALNILFRNEPRLSAVFNVFPVLMLSSGALTTLLFSGGWALQILLCLIFINELKKS